MHHSIFLVAALVTCSYHAIANDAKTSGTASNKVVLKDGTWDDVNQLIKANSGKIVVVDLWSTSCRPCVKEFPGLLKLQKQFGSPVTCVSFNLDYAGIKRKPPEYYRPRVEKFLVDSKAEIHNFLSTVGGIDVMEAVEIDSIPAVFVYGKTGEIAKRFDATLLEDGEDEAFTYKDDITPFVGSLLK